MFIPYQSPSTCGKEGEYYSPRETILLLAEGQDDNSERYVLSWLTLKSWSWPIVPSSLKSETSTNLNPEPIENDTNITYYIANVQTGDHATQLSDTDRLEIVTINEKDNRRSQVNQYIPNSDDTRLNS